MSDVNGTAHIPEAAAAPSVSRMDSLLSKSLDEIVAERNAQKRASKGPKRGAVSGGKTAGSGRQERKEKVQARPARPQQRAPMPQQRAMPAGTITVVKRSQGKAAFRTNFIAHVSKLPTDIISDELRSIFADCRALEAEVTRGRGPFSHGTVTFRNDNDLQRAIKEYNEALVNGVAIGVKVYVPRD